MNLTRHCTTEPDLKTLRQYLSIHSPGGYNVDTGASMYNPTILDTADEKRKVHLWQCVEIHDELFPHLAQKAYSNLRPIS